MIRATLTFHGAYYLATALWSLVDIQSFFLATRYASDPFKTRANAVLFLALGILFLWTRWRRDLAYPMQWAGLVLAAGTMLVERVYLPRINNPPAFWADFGVHLVLALIYLASLVRRRHESV